MFKINLKNCNNISECDIDIKKDTLNIFYAINGTGKSTIGKALELLAKKEALDSLKPFKGDLSPVGSVNDDLGNVLLFNEDFVKTIVFDKSEVIKNAFDVFIKTPKYDLVRDFVIPTCTKFLVNEKVLNA